MPLDTPGIEIQPIYTLSDEKTNATFYTNVRVPDRYRVGEVNGGMAVIGYALEIEHGGGGVGLSPVPMQTQSMPHFAGHAASARTELFRSAIGWCRFAWLGPLHGPTFLRC